MEARLIQICKDAVSDVEYNKFPDFLSSFQDRQNKARDKGYKELENLMKLLWGVFSMYFEFSKGQPFAPHLIGADGRRTLLPEDLTEGNMNNLEEILKISDNPEFVARISDVLWFRRRNHTFARKAVNAYLKSVDNDKNNESWVPKSQWMNRSAQIAMELGGKAQERQIVKKKLMEQFEDRRNSCFNPEWGFWPYNILSILVENKLVDDWEDMGDKAFEIAKGFPVSPGCDEPRAYYGLAAKCYQYANRPQKAKDAKLAIAKHWEEEARSFKTPNGCDGFNLSHRLEKAIQAYRDVEGKKEKVEELIHEMKEANKLALNQMKPIATKVDVKGLIKIADDSLKGKSGMDIILAFASLYIPLSYIKEKSSQKKMMEEHPIQSIFAKISFTSEGNISKKSPSMFDDYEGRVKAETINQYNLRQNLVASTILRQGISIILESDETWKLVIKELVNTSDFVPNDRRDIYERAIINGFESDFLVFTHLIIPQIENSIRLIFLKNKMKTTSALQSGVQREKDLNDLLTDENAEKIFGKDLLWEMRSLLIEQSGPNLRNRLCHGLMDSDSLKSASSIFLLWLTVYLLFGFKDQ